MWSCNKFLLAVSSGTVVSQVNNRSLVIFLNFVKMLKECSEGLFSLKREQSTRQPLISCQLLKGKTHRENWKEIRKFMLQLKYSYSLHRKNYICEKATAIQEISNFNIEKKMYFAMLLSIIETSCSLLSSCRNNLSLTKSTMKLCFYNNLSLKSIKYKIKE